jgi:hypothetical protein
MLFAPEFRDSERQKHAPTEADAHRWLGKKEEAPDLVHIGASQNGGSAA